MRSRLPSLLSLPTLAPALALGAASAPAWVVRWYQGRSNDACKGLICADLRKPQSPNAPRMPQDSPVAGELLRIVGGGMLGAVSGREALAVFAVMMSVAFGMVLTMSRTTNGS